MWGSGQASADLVRALTLPELTLQPCSHYFATLRSGDVVCKSCVFTRHVLRPPDLTGTLSCGEIPSCILLSQGRSQKLTFPVSLQSRQGVGLRPSNQMHQPRTMRVQMCGIYFLRRIGGRVPVPSPSVPVLVSVGSAVGSVTSSNSNETSAAATWCSEPRACAWLPGSQAVDFRQIRQGHPF